MELTQTLPAQGSAGENLYLHLESSNTVAAIHREETPGKTPGRKLGVTFQGGEPPPSTQYLGSVQNCCGFTKGLGFTVKYQRGARQGDSEGQGPIPAGIWSRKMQRVW